MLSQNVQQSLFTTSAGIATQGKVAALSRAPPVQHQRAQASNTVMQANFSKQNTKVDFGSSMKNVVNQVNSTVDNIVNPQASKYQFATAGPSVPTVAFNS